MSSESSAAVQREAESERADLVSTLDQLRENLKPENVVDEVLAGARITTAEISDKIWRTARNNPIPSVLIGLGAAMLLGVGGAITARSTSRDDDWSDEDRAATDGVRSRIGGLNSTGPDHTTFASLSRATDSAKQRLVTQLQAVGSKAADSTSKTADSAQALRDQASRKVSAYASSAREGLNSISGENAMSQSNRSRDHIAGSISRLLDEQPLVLAALGVAVGAAIGAAIPSTEAEGRLMGDASVSVKNRAQELAQQEYAHIKETASATVDNLKQAAADRGVSTDNLSGLIHDAGNTVKDAASNVANHAADTTSLKS